MNISKMDLKSKWKRNRGKRLKQCVSLILIFAMIFTMWGPDWSVYADYNTSTLSGEMLDVESGNKIGISATSTAAAFESIDTAYFTVQGDYSDTLTYTASLYINNESTSSSSATSGVLADTVGGTVDIQPGSANRKEVAVDFTQNKTNYVASGENYSIIINLSFTGNESVTVFGYNSDGSVTGLLDTSGDGLDESDNYVRVKTTSAASVDDTDVTLSADKTVLSTGESTDIKATLSPAYQRDVEYSIAGDGSVLSVDTSAEMVTAGSTSGTETVTATVGTKTSSLTFYVFNQLSVYRRRSKA